MHYLDASAINISVPNTENEFTEFPKKYIKDALDDKERFYCYCIEITATLIYK